MLRKVLWIGRELLNGNLAYEFKCAAGSRYNLAPALCPCCGFEGIFRGHGNPTQFGVQCPKCRSLTRHRLVASAIENGFLSFCGKNVLHFAPEPSLSRLIDGQEPARRVTSSYPDQSGDLRLNIEAIELPDKSFDTIVCSHILEHVDDRKALAELYRVLRPGGELVIEVPIVEGWATTYENPGAHSDGERHIHFGQWNHVRFYGRDLRDRIKDAGFELSEYTASPQDVVRYGLQRGETVFVGLKA